MLKLVLTFVRLESSQTRLSNYVVPVDVYVDSD